MTPPAVPVPTAPAPYAESLDPHPDYPGVRNFLVSISAMPAYAHLSVEELRLCDYTAAGSAAVPFACTLDVDADPPAVFGSLVAMPEYKHASIEEVRLEDYWVVDGGKAVRPVADHVFAEGAPAVLPANDDAFRIARGRPGDGMDDATRGGRPRRVPRGRTQYGVRTRLRRRVEQLDRLGATPEGPASDSDPEPDPEPPRPASPPARTPERRRLPRRPHALGRSPSVPLAPPSSRPCLASSSSAHGLGASPRRRRSDELCESPAPTAGRARASLFRQLQAMARKAEAIDDALAAGGEDADAVQSLVAKAEEFSAALDKVSSERGPAFGRYSEATGAVQRNLDAFAFSPRKEGPRYFDDPGFVGPLPKRTSFDAFVAPYPVYRARRAEEETALEAGRPCSKPRLDTASAVGGGSGVRSSPVTPFVVGDAVGQPAGSSADVVRELPDKEEDAPADDAHALQFVPMMSVSLGPDRAQAAGPVSQRKPIVSAVFKPLSGTLSPELTAASLKAETTKAEPSLVRAPKREAILAGSDDGETTALAKSPGAMSYRVRAADRPDTRKRDIAGALSPARALPGRRKMRTFRAAKKTKSEPDGTFDGGGSPFDFDGVLPGTSPGASPSKPPAGGSSVARKLERFGGTYGDCVRVGEQRRDETRNGPRENLPGGFRGGTEDDAVGGREAGVQHGEPAEGSSSTSGTLEGRPVGGEGARVAGQKNAAVATVDVG